MEKKAQMPDAQSSLALVDLEIYIFAAASKNFRQKKTKTINQRLSNMNNDP